jgi:spore germination protein GerM
MNLIDNPDQAKRLARAILSDVAMYNKEKVENGIKNDNIFDVLKEEIEEGRQHMLSRVSSGINPETIYEIAVVDVLIKRAGKIESSIW